jgi:hypothetical protein
MKSSDEEKGDMAASSEHTFPISAAEQHKLDEMKEIIRHPPAVRKIAGGVRGKSWLVLLGFVLLGVGWVRRRIGR